MGRQELLDELVRTLDEKRDALYPNPSNWKLFLFCIQCLWLGFWYSIRIGFTKNQ